MQLGVGRPVWFTGLSGAGKSTLCTVLASTLAERGYTARILDADHIRSGLCSDLGYSTSDRAENVRRLAHIAQLLSSDYDFVLIAAISPLNSMRHLAKTILPQMFEVYVDAPLSLCEQRDPKGLYLKARSGLLKEFTGIDSPFEVPLNPDTVCHTDREPVAECVLRLVDALCPHHHFLNDQPSTVVRSRRR